MAEDAINRLQDSQPVVNKKVELLRALERTVGQFNELIGWPFDDQNPLQKDGLPCSGADGEYTDLDKNFLQDFKKIFHLGSAHLERFINNLIASGEELDPESLLYYIDQLFNGPFGDIAAGLARDQKNFKNAPDIMGVMGDHGITLGLQRGVARPNSSVPVGGGWPATNAAALTHNKCPEFIKALLMSNTGNVQGVYNNSSQQLRMGEIEMPQIDKFIQYRLTNENVTFIRNAGDPKTGQLNGQHVPPPEPKIPPGWGTEEGEAVDTDLGLYNELRALRHDGQNHRTHGNIGVKDVEFYNTLATIGPQILDAVEEFLEEADWNLCMFKKSINYFNPTKNTAISENESVSRTLEYMVRAFADDNEKEPGKETVEVKKISKETDLFGNAFVSDDRMAFELKIPDHKGPGEDGTFKLYTVEGQLGSGKGDPNSESIIK